MHFLLLVSGSGKTMLLLYATLVCFMKSALSGITTTPGMQRKYIGESASLQWSVTETLSSYSVYNLQSGTLSSYANYTQDSKKGVITLIIWNIRLTDAGNYSLSITIGSATQIDSSALLFVYGYPTPSVTQTSGGSPQQPATEGDTVELTCTLISASLPAAYRTRIFYQWQLSWIGTLQNISSGQATLVNTGDSVPGYSIKNDGKILVITSAQYRDTQTIYCYGQEQWSPYRYGASIVLPLRYRPQIGSRSPASNKFNAIVGDSVSLTFSFSAMPALTSATNWTFINTAGQVQDLPEDSVFSNTDSPCYLQFTFASEAYYGNYSIILNNIIGSKTETFQVLRPGPPDAPSNVKSLVASPYLIAIAFNCMWLNGRQQTISLQLKALYNDSVVDFWSSVLGLACYNSTYTTQFINGIQPETDYEVLVWSTNNLGSSDIIKLRVKTTKIFKFFVSPATISLNGNQAIVNFSATEAKIARLDVTCCLETTGSCYSSNYYNVNSTTGQLTYDNMPSADVYVFDFRVNGGDLKIAVYYLTMVKGVRVSRNEDDEDDPTTEPGDEWANTLPITVIVLGVLLGIAVLALIGCLVAFLVFKRRQETQQNNSHQAQQPWTTGNTRTPQPTTAPTNQAYEEDDTYEAVDNNRPKSDAYYTALEGQRYS